VAGDGVQFVVILQVVGDCWGAVTGRYDYHLVYDQPPPRSAAEIKDDPATADFIGAVQKQLGLSVAEDDGSARFLSSGLRGQGAGSELTILKNRDGTLISRRPGKLGSGEFGE
jgi:hypothetical protein